MIDLDPIRRAFKGGLLAQGYTEVEPQYTRAWREALVSFVSAIRPKPKEVELLSASEIHDIVYSCIRAISRTAAQVPLVVVRGNEELRSHALKDLLEKPNPEQTTFDFIEGILWMLLLSGNCFIEQVFSRGRPVQLWIITEPVQILPDSETGLVKGYRVQVIGKTLDFAPWEILHIRLFHPRNAWYGLPPLAAYREGLITDLRAFTYNRSLLENHAVPGGVIELYQPVTEEQARQVAERFERLHKGPERAGRVAVLSRGARFQQIGLTPRDVLYVQQRRLSRESLKALFGVSGILLGEDDQITFASASISLQVFFHTTVLPLLRKIEAALNHKLVPLVDPSVAVRFDASRVEILQESLDLKTQIAERMLRTGRSLNEIRDEVYKKPPLDEVAADQIFVPANLVPIGYANKAVLGQVPQELARIRGQVLEEPQGDYKWYVWDLSEAIGWLKEHGFSSSEYIKEVNFYAFRQADPDDFVAFRTQYVGKAKRPKDPEPNDRPVKFTFGIKEDGTTEVQALAFYHGEKDLS